MREDCRGFKASYYKNMQPKERDEFFDENPNNDMYGIWFYNQYRDCFPAANVEALTRKEMIAVRKYATKIKKGEIII